VWEVMVLIDLWGSQSSVPSVERFSGIQRLRSFSAFPYSGTDRGQSTDVCFYTLPYDSVSLIDFAFHLTPTCIYPARKNQDTTSLKSPQMRSVYVYTPFPCLLPVLSSHLLD
jgi:hypothetical protein